MRHAAPETHPASLAGRPLFTVDFDVAGGILAFGASPFGDQRVGHISGGRFTGERLSGIVLPGGGNWSRTGRLGTDASVGTFDANAILQAEDGALIHMRYTGRSLVPDAVRAAFADPTTPDVPPDRYYLRIAPVFETASPAHAWLNGILAVGIGQRTPSGVRHIIHEVL